MLEEKKITIEVPASTGNVGPGFDCIGLAVDIWNKVTIEKSDGTFEILNQGISKEKYDSIPIKENLITKGILLACPEIDLNKFKKTNGEYQKHDVKNISYNYTLSNVNALISYPEGGFPGVSLNMIDFFSFCPNNLSIDLK